MHRHELVDGKLLQMDKRYGDLKQKQKEKISIWLDEEMKAYYLKNGELPVKRKDYYEVLDNLYQRIQQADIWIPKYEIIKHYSKRYNRIIKRFESNIEKAGEL